MDHLETFAGRARGLLGAGALLLVLTAPAGAQEPVAPPEAQDTARTHVVRPGDTLWDLAEHYYGDPWKWPRIHQANTGLVANPHFILPAWRLIIPGLEPGAEPETGLLGVPVRELGQVAPVAAEAEQEQLPPPARTVFFPRDERSVVFAEDVPRPVVSPGEFYAASWLTEGAPVPIVGTVADRFSRDAQGQVLAETAHPYTQLYIAYGPAGLRPEIGQRLLAVRQLRAVNGYGTILEPRGIVQVASLDPEVFSATVVRQFGELAVGDLVLPVEPAPDLTGLIPQQLTSGPEGRIVDFLDPQPIYGTQDHAFVDLGRAQGLGVGDELIVILPARRDDNMGEVLLPPEVVARLRVLRVGERTATTKVIQLTEPVLEPGLPVRLVGQIQ